MDTLINNKSCVCKTKHYAYYACKTCVCVCAQCISSGGGVTQDGTSWSSHPEPGFLNHGTWITNPNDFAVDVIFVFLLMMQGLGLKLVST